ncbi:hypothetical protein RAZWK3B_16855 [Roseobacter sp. AzwK-3b]|nr:hypothetical protein RAZWK3B_16855 [Roseobacter sp. AzwK-3b]
MASTPFTKADIARAVAGAAEGGFQIGVVEIRKDGTIRILPPETEKSKTDTPTPEPW